MTSNPIYNVVDVFLKVVVPNREKVSTIQSFSVSSASSPMGSSVVELVVKDEVDVSYELDD